MPENTPLVSVVMAVHNGLPYVEEALRSLMAQSLEAIEIIVVDDASTDGTAEVITRLATEDARIRPIYLRENHRLPGALNCGLDIARAPYVARLDADDRAHPERLARQKAWLDQHPEVQLLACSVRRIDHAGRTLWIDFRDLIPPVLHWRSYFEMPIVHPTFMFRRLDPDGVPWRYDTGFPVAQDYDFLARVLLRGEAASLPDVLVDWRAHGDSTSARMLEQQRTLSRVISARIRDQELAKSLADEALNVIDVFHRRRPATPWTTFKGLRSVQRLLSPAVQRHSEAAQGLRVQAVAVMKFAFGESLAKRACLYAMMSVVAPRVFVAGIAERRSRRKRRRRHTKLS